MRGKCVLNIVPKNSKKKTFKMDPKCKIKRGGKDKQFGRSILKDKFCLFNISKYFIIRYQKKINFILMQ